MEENPQSSSNGPGQLYDPYASNERIMERLKLLNYESGFVSQSPSYRLLPRHYFTQGTNPGEQFHLFTALAVWLLGLVGGGGQREMPHEFDDPNTTIQGIVDGLRAEGVEVDFTPSKLKSGSGPQCLYVLEQLSRLAMERTGVRVAGGVEVVQQGDDGAEGESEESQLDEAEVTAAELVADEEELEDDVSGLVVRVFEMSVGSF